MKVTADIHEFYRKTGIILFRQRLRELGILTDDVSGTFRTDDVDDILDFCAHNANFHIVTYLDDLHATEMTRLGEKATTMRGWNDAENRPIFYH